MCEISAETTKRKDRLRARCKRYGLRLKICQKDYVNGNITYEKADHYEIYDNDKFITMSVYIEGVELFLEGWGARQSQETKLLQKERQQAFKRW